MTRQDGNKKRTGLIYDLKAFAKEKKRLIEQQNREEGPQLPLIPQISFVTADEP